MVKTSTIWLHFEVCANGTDAVCKYCNAKVVYKNSTSSLWNHYNCKHRTRGGPIVEINTSVRISFESNNSKICVAVDLEKRFGFNVFDLTTIDGAGIAQLASFLDPRHKDLAFETIATRHRIIEDVRSLINKHEVDVQTNTSNITKQDTIMDFLLGKSDVSNTEELERYIAETQIDHNFNPCVWWKEHQDKFLTLAKLAQKLLCILATSAEVVRVFSAAGNIVSSRRSCMLTENVSMLLFLHENRKFLHTY